MSGVKRYNPNSRATEIIAALSRREPLHGIERICDEQKQISTGRLYAYATEAGDKLAGYACELRQALNSLRQDHTEAQRLLRERDALAQRCRELEACIAGDHTNLVALLRMGQAKAERERDALRAAISDPESVFVNMKRGTIAKPSMRSMIDLYGEVVNGDEAQLLEIAKLRAEVERLNLHVENAQQHALTMGNKAIDLAGREIDLRAEVETLREIREIASQCAANGGYLNSQDLIELRELLKK